MLHLRAGSPWCNLTRAFGPYVSCTAIVKDEALSGSELISWGNPAPRSPEGPVVSLLVRWQVDGPRVTLVSAEYKLTTFSH